jgi:hypothetical protein
MVYRKAILCIALALAAVFSVSGQCLNINLVKNPGLEDYVCCPVNFGMIDCATHWSQPRISGSTSEYFNVCAVDSLLPTIFFWQGIRGDYFRQFRAPNAAIPRVYTGHII